MRYLLASVTETDANVTVPKNVNLDILALSQLQDNIAYFILKLYNAPPRRSVNVQNYLDEYLPHWWVGQIVDYNIPFTRRPPRSLDLTLSDFFMWGNVMDKILQRVRTWRQSDFGPQNAYATVPPLPVDLGELKELSQPRYR
ncbi:hypothetical protein TNCV_3836751 [Trichonephila clavipes]|nr:hypothetical protein TNCV_3836751 [Trichonephila clavipes]